MNQTAFTTGQAICGYRIQQVSPLPAINAHLIQLLHEKTKAVHIHIANEDKENTFGVFFRTVPTDSTGVAHILEHTVLCGSKKYKVRDPFFSMLKRSLSTFMNAFTASDWTMYPFSTQNKKDYYNLMDVYLDAAFFPEIDRLSFKQEGHRLELEPGENGEPELVYKGVVYNEMKGDMSSPGQVMSRRCLKGSTRTLPMPITQAETPQTFQNSPTRTLRHFTQGIIIRPTVIFIPMGIYPWKKA